MGSNLTKKFINIGLCCRDLLLDVDIAHVIMKIHLLLYLPDKFNYVSAWPYAQLEKNYQSAQEGDDSCFKYKKCMRNILISSRSKFVDLYVSVFTTQQLFVLDSVGITKPY